jgi:FkbM family methyltransferase
MSNVSIYSACLPYNLNWHSRNWGPLRDFLSRNPIHVIDVGARGGSLEELESLRSFIDYTGFDADVEEAARLNAAGGHGFHASKVLPYFIGSREGSQSFNLYKNPGDSSQLMPNARFVAFSSNFGIERSVTVFGTTIDAMFRAGELHDADIVKLDTQGTEFEILTAAGRALDVALMVEAEVEFVEMYKDQKLFHDVCDILYKRGFILLYLNRAFVGRDAYQAPSRGQMIFGDALFGLKEEIAEKLPAEKKLKYIALLIQYGIMDYAHHLYINDASVIHMAPSLESVFGDKFNTTILGKVWRRILMQMDKVIALLLHLRGTNQLRVDSDRSWPVR